MDRAAGMISFPGKKRAAVQIMSIIRGNQMIAHPDGVFPLDHGQDILPSLVAPALLILRRGISNKIGQAAFAAAMTGLFKFMIHRDPAVKKSESNTRIDRGPR
jgi:hypothetical protein